MWYKIDDDVWTNIILWLWEHIVREIFQYHEKVLWNHISYIIEHSNILTMFWQYRILC